MFKKEIRKYSIVFYICGSRYDFLFSADSNGFFEIVEVEADWCNFNEEEIKQVSKTIGLRTRGLINLINKMTTQLKKIDKSTSCMAFNYNA